MSERLRWSTAIETRDLIASGEFTALQVMEACFERIARLDSVIHAFIALDREEALRSAVAADEAVAGGQSPGPLHGVPVALKDDLWVEGMPATCGSLLFANFRPSYDGTIAERLKAAGAIIVGKTNMSEFAAWPRSQSWFVGETRNPWDTDRIAGASSGGSAAAVASGMVPIAIGTDGGGSIRIPAALNGLVGLFPTVGRVPGYGSFCCSPTESAGPITRTVADTALVQQLIAGPDPRASHARRDPAPDVLSGLLDGLRDIRIGWSADFGWIPIDPSIAASARNAVEALGQAGATVSNIAEPVPHPWGDAGWMASLHRDVAALGEMARPTAEAPRTDGVEAWLGSGAASGELMFLAPEFQALLAKCFALLTPPQQALVSSPPAARQPPLGPLVEDFAAVLNAHDVICSPTMATVAPVAPSGWGSGYSDSFMGTHFTFIANSAGCPAITVPCGIVDGLPVGLQVIGRPGNEALTLRVAAAVEAVRGDWARPPYGRDHHQPARPERHATATGMHLRCH